MILLEAALQAVLFKQVLSEKKKKKKERGPSSLGIVENPWERLPAD